MTGGELDRVRATRTRCGASGEIVRLGDRDTLRGRRRGSPGEYGRERRDGLPWITRGGGDRSRSVGERERCTRIVIGSEGR